MSKDIIFRKLDQLTAELQKLKNLTAFTLKEYISDFTKSYTGERILEKIVGIAIDINTHIIVSLGEKVPDTYYESFIFLSKFDIYSLEFAKDIAGSARVAK